MIFSKWAYFLIFCSADEVSKAQAAEDVGLREKYNELLERYKLEVEQKKEIDAAAKRQMQAYTMKEAKYREHVG